MKLRPYQIEDVKKLAPLKAGACFNEQRTGKTPTIISLCKIKKFEKILIITTKTGIPVWTNEVKTWSKLSVSYKKDLKKYQNGAVILNYDAVKQTSVAKGCVQQLLDLKFDAIIIDEAHKIRNNQTALTKAIFKLSKIPYRYALTGTPSLKTNVQIWPILHFLYPKHFRGMWKFIEEYFHTYQINLPNQQITKAGKIKENKKQELINIIDSFSTNRKRSEVMKWLPKKDIQDVFLAPTSKQTQYIKELSEMFEIENTNIVCEGDLDRLIRYRQVCLDPEILDLPGNSPKTNWIIDFINENITSNIIIFSKFTTYIKLLQKKSKEQLCSITGETPIKIRETVVKQFQKAKGMVLLIQIDAGKEALTLDNADYTIFTDRYPPIGDIQQAEDRCIATTEKAIKPQTIFNLIIKGTYDEVISEQLKHSASEVDLINNFKKYIKGGK